MGAVVPLIWLTPRKMIILKCAFLELRAKKPYPTKKKNRTKFCVYQNHLLSFSPTNFESHTPQPFKRIGGKKWIKVLECRSNWAIGQLPIGCFLHGMQPVFCHVTGGVEVSPCEGLSAPQQILAGIKITAREWDRGL